MIRMLGIALVILGLIAQPLMAAMPDSMPMGDTSSSMSMDHSGGDQPSQAPCHETTTDQVAPMSCTDCDSDCANGACASACSLSALAVLIPVLPKFEHLSAVLVVGPSGALVHALPSRIFHPPKHA